MRKHLFFTVVLSLCILDFGAFAATTRGSARVVNNKNADVTAQQSSGTVARSAVRSTATRATKKTTATQSAAQQTNAAPVQQNSNVVARAATKQKALNTGTKVAGAMENTAVPQECQEAFYGCMDSFCMLDNASGGRCQCSDRIVELDQVLDDILKLDEQTYVMATEGVERIQMGEAEEQIMARAKAAGDKVVAQSKADANKKQSRQLDLSAWNNNVFTLDEDVFDSFDSSDSINTFADKKGEALYVASAKMCAAQISEKCVDYTSMLQLVYAQKIKSDCMAYENSLKAQKSQSQQKLLTAQKALRDAALDEYQNQNKYTTVGECVVAFTSCMQTTAECGTDYTGCVTLAAAENVKNNTSGSKAKQTKIKGAVSGADITLAATTLEQLLAKKTICESVTKQCVNANKNDAVWTAFLRNAAPALKSAELIAEQNLRSSCLPSVAECFKNSCRAEFGDNEANYDACLSNPEIYKSLCKVQLEPCLEATGGTFDSPTDSSLWNALVAMLNAMKVDACTNEIKSCLTERCGDDFSGCIGLDTDSIGNLCPIDKLTACVSGGRFARNAGDGSENADNIDEIREYISQIAQGLALQIDNALATACQNAANDSMLRVCGDINDCQAAKFDLLSLTSLIKPQACKYNDAEGSDTTCYPDITNFSDNEIFPFVYEIKWEDEDAGKIMYVEKVPVAESGQYGYGVYPTLYGKPNMLSIVYNTDMNEFASSRSNDDSEESTQAVIRILNNSLQRIMSSIESDPKVTYCREGRVVQGFNSSSFGGGQENVRFPNLTDNMYATVANNLLSLLYNKNTELEKQFEKDLDALDKKISERIAEISETRGVNVESQIDAKNMQSCTCDKTMTKSEEPYYDTCLTVTDPYRCKDGKCQPGSENPSGYTIDRYIGSRKEVTDVIGTYNANTNICTLTTKKYVCKNWNGTRCLKYDNGTALSTTTVQMDKYN